MLSADQLLFINMKIDLFIYALVFSMFFLFTNLVYFYVLGQCNDFCLGLILISSPDFRDCDLHIGCF